MAPPTSYRVCGVAGTIKFQIRKVKNMSKIKHTPGPYAVSGTSIVAGDICIAVIEDDGGYEAPAEQREANAILLAAAPDLLEGCKTLLHIIKQQVAVVDTKFDNGITSALAAIAKAEGEVQS